MTGQQKVHVDKETCMSSGHCVQSAPDAFRFDADELAEPTAAAADLSAARLSDIAFQCPAGAITVRTVD
jgi:ferredoxin